MSTSYKAEALAHDLADRLKSRLNGSLDLVESYDTDGNPLINIGDGNAGDPNFLIKVRPQAWPLAKDVLGLDANMFSPTVIQLVTEADPAGGAGADPTTRAQLGPVFAQLVLMGTAIEWYESDSGNAPQTSDISANKLKTTIYPDNYRPLISQQ